MRLFTRLTVSVAILLGTIGNATAQMSLSFSGIEITTKSLTDGTTLVEFPVGTDLTTIMQKASITVGDSTVSSSDVVPNPTSLSLEDDQVVVFYYKGKAYQFHFSEGKYFTAVFMSDPHIGQNSGASVSAMQGYVKNIVAMGKAAGPCFRFDALPSYNPTCDIAFSMGDMDEDNKKDASDFESAHAGFNDAKIPFITMCGNHDLVPDYWTGEDADLGFTTSGKTSNNVALTAVTDQLSTAKNNGIENLERFSVTTSGSQQAEPWTFTFNGVRFYCGQTYWFQKIYGSTGTNETKLGSITLISKKESTHYAPDGVISALETFVNSHTTEPSVWMQHYPFVAGSDCNRWWLDQNDIGTYIKTEDSSEYGTNDDVDIYTASSAITVATKKKDKLASIINKTKNPVHFSGHVHSFAENTYSGIKDYTVGNARCGEDSCAAYVVLMKGNKGVVEVKQAYFSCTGGSIDDRQNSSTEFVGGTEQNDNAVLAQMAGNFGNLSSTAFANGISEANSATTSDAVSEAIEALDKAFADYYNDNAKDGTLDVSKLLGTNLDFSTAQGTVNSVLTNCYPQAAWNTHVRTAATTANKGYIHLTTSSSNNAGGTSPEVYIRAKWQIAAATEQIVKQTALPTGSYTLSLKSQLVAEPTTNLCYYELNGKRTTFTPGGELSLDISVDKPSLFTLSLGFVGGAGGTENGLYADDVSLVCTSANYVHPYWAALSAAKAEAESGNAAQAAVDQYEWTAEELAAQDDETVEKAIAVLNNGATISQNSEVATSLISNADFSSQTTDANCSSNGSGGYPSDWTFTYSLDGWKDCFVSGNAFNAWAGTITQAELYQTLNNLPKGAYRLTAEVKTNVEDGSESDIAIYLNAGWPVIGRSEECRAKTNSSTFETYSCAADADNNSLTVGIRSDKGYYQIKNIALTYLGPTADHEAETDASYFQQDYYWGCRSLTQVDATGDKYKNAEGIIVYPLQANQLVKAAKSNAFATMTNVVVNGKWSNLVVTDGSPFLLTDTVGAFKATKASFTRDFKADTKSSVCLPFAPSNYSGEFYTLTSQGDQKLHFTSVDAPEGNTPYIYIGKQDETLSAKNVAIAKTPETMESEKVNGYYLKGVFSNVEAENVYGYTTEGNFVKASSTTLVPFRAFIMSPDDVSSSSTRILECLFGGDETTAIERLEQSAERVNVYSVSGQLLRRGVERGRALDTLPSGVYVVGGNKVTK